MLRLMTLEPWRTHGAALTAREQAALEALAGTDVPAPRSLALDAHGTHTGHPAHLMTLLPGRPTLPDTTDRLRTMAELLATIHETRPEHPFRAYQSWAPQAKWEVPAWTRSPASWRRAFDLLADGPPEFPPTFLHRDFSHRNLLWQGEEISGVVDWVETSTGPAWLDACHAVTALAVTARRAPGPRAPRRVHGVHRPTGREVLGDARRGRLPAAARRKAAVRRGRRALPPR